MQKIGIISNRKVVEHQAVFRQAVEYLEKHKKDILFDKNSAKLLGDREGLAKEQILKEADMVITLGGDGAVLKTARVIDEQKRTPVLAVNMGTLGFLTEISPRRLIWALDQVFKKGDYVLDLRTLLRVTVYREGEKIFTTLALNDAVINQGNFARLITLRTEIERRKVMRMRADGLIISTPTGSTGHALSAGGPIVHPLLEALIITPICPAGLFHRPIVIPNDRQIKFVLETERREDDMISDVGLTVDGQVVFPLKYGDEIKVRNSSRFFPLIRLRGHIYYKVLRQKLGWGV